MKIQFVFLSLFLATAHAGHEPGLRGRVGDDQDLELLGLGNTVVPHGSSARIQCGSGSQCCVTGSIQVKVNYGFNSFGGGNCQGGFTMDNGILSTCASQSCSISCDGTCDVTVKANGGGGGSGGMPAAPGMPGVGYPSRYRGPRPYPGSSGYPVPQKIMPRPGYGGGGGGGFRGGGSSQGETCCFPFMI